MPVTKRPLTTAVAVVALNAALWCSANSAYDFVCDLPYWQRQRERRRQERELQLQLEKQRGERLQPAAQQQG
ncbi:unnamed protein product [Closterium sp. NIES-65]|nr:unnamed protein product [Closterium sp. NIES-65]